MDYSRENLVTKVVECYEHNGKIFVVLEDSIFYPLKGGQNPDGGYIGAARVLDVFEHDGSKVHQVDIKVIGEVECVLDKDIRYRNSFLHTAQHLFSAVVEVDGVVTTSFNMKDDYFTMDIVKTVTREELNQFENQINAYILKSLPVKCRMYDAKTDSELDFSYLGLDASEVKLTIIEGLVKDICGGTHIDNLSELKFFKIVKYKYMGESTRITAYVGDKAIEFCQKYFDNYSDLIKIVNQSEDKVLNFVEDKLKELKKLKKEYKRLEKKMSNEQ